MSTSKDWYAPSTFNSIPNLTDINLGSSMRLVHPAPEAERTRVHYECHFRPFSDSYCPHPYLLRN